MAIERKNEPPQRTVSPFPVGDDRHEDSNVRPTRFGEYIGQKNVRERIEVAVRAALIRGDSLDHVLLSGPPGLGKTTLARIIARELGVSIFITSGPALDRKGDLAGILTSLEPRDILFIDEIHRLNPAVEENLYPAMEDFTFDIVVGTGPGANTIRLPLNPFTLIGATTRTGLLTSPLRSRFGIVERLDFYTVSELLQIVRRSAEILHFELTEEGGLELAQRSRGTPRIVNRLLRRVSDYALVNDTPAIDLEVAQSALQQLEIDEIGFDSTDRLLLSALVNTFEGGPVGLDTLAAATGESPDAIEDVYEPYFLQQGFIQRTPRGRIATQRAFEYFGKPRPPDEGQGSLELV